MKPRAGQIRSRGSAGPSPVRTAQRNVHHQLVRPAGLRLLSDTGGNIVRREVMPLHTRPVASHGYCAAPSVSASAAKRRNETGATGDGVSFHRIPFRATRRIMTHGDRQTESIIHLVLQILFPGPEIIACF
jgi:hypothetical protein